MKHVLAIVGSPRKNGRTSKMTQQLAERLENYENIQVETIHLSDYEILPCKGCELCLKKGENFCPLKDDVSLLFEKMMLADGIIMATPNYSLQVSSLLKGFLDRVAFVFHRPCFFHKVWMPVVVQGAYGGKSITKYLNELGGFWGFITTPGLNYTLPANEVLVEKKDQIDALISKGAATFASQLQGDLSPRPSLKRLSLFRLQRTFHQHHPSDEYIKDHDYYQSKGWFSSDYYYETPLNPLKRLVGFLVDRFAYHQATK